MLVGLCRSGAGPPPLEFARRIRTQKSELAIADPQPLLPDDFGRPLGDTHTSFDATAEGDFLLTQLPPTADLRPRIYGVLNWAQRLRQ